MASIDDPTRPKIVGCLGDACVLDGLDSAAVESLTQGCDLIEVRLDRLTAAQIAARPWRVLAPRPLLFTARAEAEGGAPGLGPEERSARLLAVLDEAAMIDVELASVPAMTEVLSACQRRAVPWLASFHDFHGVPAIAELEARRDAARQAGAWGFKAAVELGWQAAAIGTLLELLASRAGFPVALMGMGPLAAASRLLYAQFGSVLNYGYLGEVPTAPGQWSAARLAAALGAVPQLAWGADLGTG